MDGWKTGEGRGRASGKEDRKRLLQLSCADMAWADRWETIKHRSRLVRSSRQRYMGPFAFVFISSRATHFNPQRRASFPAYPMSLLGVVLNASSIDSSEG
jgi:hypothetical protein